MRRQEFVRNLNALPSGSLCCESGDAVQAHRTYGRVVRAGGWILEDMTSVPADLRRSISQENTTPFRELLELGVSSNRRLWRLAPPDQPWVIYIAPKKTIYPAIAVIWNGELDMVLTDVGPFQFSFHLRALLD